MFLALALVISVFPPVQVPTFVCGRSVQQIPREQLVHYPIAVCANPHLRYGKKKKRRRMDTEESILDAILIYKDTTTPKIQHE